jgi:SAM-dependent methyltransferase
METGYKLIRADILRDIPLTSHGFALEPELVTKLARWDLRLYEVPISYQGRSYAEGKKIGVKDLFAALWAIVKYRFFSRRFTTREGFQMLQSTRRARGFNRWLLSQMAPYVGRRVLEAGSGIGNLTQLLLDRERLACVDADPFCVERISQRHGHLDNLSVHQVDLSKLQNCSELRKACLDTIVCINALGPIEDDSKVLLNFFQLLRPGGHALLLVPADPRPFTGVDQPMGHVHCYTTDSLALKLKQAGFEVLESRGFNRFESLNWLLPLAKLVKRLPLLPHTSVIAVGRKPTALRPSRVKQEGEASANVPMLQELVAQD